MRPSINVAGGSGDTASDGASGGAEQNLVYDEAQPALLWAICAPSSAARPWTFGMDFEQLRTFQQVCRLSSFSRAAEKLGISAQIRSLEKEVGARLFDRDGGRVTFTAAGRLFEPFADHCLQCQSHIIVSVNDLYKSARGEGSVSCSEATSLYILPPVFSHYKKQYARVNLNIVRSEHTRSLEAVFNRDVDFAIASMPVKDPRLVVQPIHRDDIVLVVAPTHPLADDTTKVSPGLGLP